MYNQAEAILSQYELEIHEVKKGRGSYICETNQGSKLITTFRGANEKGLLLKLLLEQLYINGFPVEQIMLNKNQEAVTKDGVTGEQFLVKDYISGRELDTGNVEELQEAVKVLGCFHQTQQVVTLEIPDKLKDSVKPTSEICVRHQKELIKAKNYIRGRKKKSEFEQNFLASFVPMMATVEKSIRILEEHPVSQGKWCHGDVNQHNFLWTGESFTLVNFESFTYGWGMSDVANFFRKVMEKNDWNPELGKLLLETYQSYIPMEQDEIMQLYGCLLYPEKYWKITNHYMSSRKSWISDREVEKLKKVIAQEEKRLNFMENLFSFQ